MVVCLHSIYFFASRNVEEDVFHHIGEIMRHMLAISLVNSNWHWYFNQFLWAILCLILKLKIDFTWKHERVSYIRTENRFHLKAWKSLPTCEGVEAASIFFMLWIQKLRTELRIENCRQIYSTACVYRSITQAWNRLLANYTHLLVMSKNDTHVSV